MLQHRAAIAAPCVAFALASAFARQAAGAEYCVTCEGPPALYRCMVEGTEDGPGKEPSLSLYCISEMVSKGGHESCAVSRGAPFPCPGLAALVKQPSQLPTLASPPPGSPTPPPNSHAESPAVEPPHADATVKPESEKPANKVPRTVEELAGQTFKSSQQGVQAAGEAIGGTAKKAGEQIGNAGSAIGNAASKTWTCITSLFNRCGDEQADAGRPDGAPGETAAPDATPAN